MKRAIADHVGCKCGLAKGHPGDCRPSSGVIRGEYKVGPQGRRESGSR